MNALHIESERRAGTVADLLTSRLRPVKISVTQNNETVYDIVGVKIGFWLKRYQALNCKPYGQSCGQFHFVVTGSEDFIQAVVVMQ